MIEEDLAVLDAEVVEASGAFSESVAKIYWRCESFVVLPFGSGLHNPSGCLLPCSSLTTL